MKSFALAWIVANAVSIIFAVFAGMLAYTGRDGWVWFLCFSLLAHVTIDEKGGAS